MGRVLISPQELAEMMKREPVVLIDTRDATGYGEAHIHGAVNIHDVFTYLATSTPEGVAALAPDVRECIRPSWPFGRRNGGHVRTVNDDWIWPVVSRLCPAAPFGLPQDQVAAWWLRRLARYRLAEQH